MTDAPSSVSEPSTENETGRARPAVDAERIQTLDVVRGVAVLGILLMNVRAFSMPFAAYGNPKLWGPLEGANLWIWIATSLLADQKFITVFSMLFGAGVALMTDRAEMRGASPLGTHYRRTGFLIAFGLVHAYLIWWGDVLFIYGIAALVVVFARRWRPRAQIACGLVLFLVPAAMTLLMHAWIEGADLSDPEQAGEIAELRAMVDPDPAELRKEIAAYRGGYVENLRFRAAMVFDFQQSFLMVFIWRIIGQMLIGMALLRLDILTGRRDARVYRALAIVGFGLGFLLSGMGVIQLMRHDFSFPDAMFQDGLWNYFGSLFGAIGWIGAVGWLCKGRALPALRARLGAVGRTAFSNYILQSSICTTLFYGFGLGLFGKVSAAGQMGVVLAVWAFQLYASKAWMERYRFGPLEWLWRGLTYGEFPPMRRSPA